MPLPRPGKVSSIPESQPTKQESLPALEQREERAPDLVQPQETPAQSFGGAQQAKPAEDPPPWTDPSAKADAPALVPPSPDDEEAEVQVSHDQPAQVVNVPATQASPVGGSMPAPSPMGQVVGGSVTGSLAEMGFDGLDLGSNFGAFASVTLKDDRYKTTDGDDLGPTFACVIHDSKAKWIVKSSNDKEADFKYTTDKVHDTSGTPLEVSFNAWRQKGIMPGEPVWKPYLDVTAQLFDPVKKELGQVVLLQIPETSIARLKGYITTCALNGHHPNTVITQVYLGQKVTSVKHPFHPWAFKTWAKLSAFV